MREELLEDGPHALVGVGPEGRRLLVGEAEADHRRVDQPGRECRLRGSGYSLSGSSWLGEMNPPALTQISPAAGVARKRISRSAPGRFVNSTATLPPTSSAGWASPPATGN